MLNGLEASCPASVLIPNMVYMLLVCFLLSEYNDTSCFSVCSITMLYGKGGWIKNNTYALRHILHVVSKFTKSEELCYSTTYVI